MTAGIGTCPWYMTPVNEAPFCMISGELCTAAGDLRKCSIEHVPYDPNTQMRISEIYPAISGEGTSTGTVCTIVRTVGCNLRCQYCVTGNTRIATPGRQKDISTVEVGDQVLAYDFETKRVVKTNVLDVSSRYAKSERLLYFKGTSPHTSLRITNMHLMYAEGEWVRARDVKLDDKLYVLTNVFVGDRLTRQRPDCVPLKKFSSISPIKQPYASRLGVGMHAKPRAMVPVYNLTTSHGNFFANRILVHNCDTVYAYEGGTPLLLKEVVASVLKIGIKTVLFTGGEPLLDRRSAHAFLLAMVHHGIKVYVETNGSVDILPFKVLANIVMDIKCPSSGMQDKLLVRNLENIGPLDEIKFIVGDREDYEYARHMVDTYKLSTRTSNLFISPIISNTITEFPQQLSRWLIEDRSLMKLMLQQHKIVWGPKLRGV